MFRVGDMVKVKENLIPREHYGSLQFIPPLYDYKGKVSIVVAVQGDTYRLKDCSFWWFSNEMLELIEPYAEVSIATLESWVRLLEASGINSKKIVKDDIEKVIKMTKLMNGDD